MKKLNLFVLLVSMLMLIVSCSEVEEPFIEGPLTDTPLNMPEFSENELIIQYEDNVNEAQKEVLREFYGAISYEACHCTDENVEKWTFEQGINVETLMNSIRADQGVGVEGIRNVDNEFSFDRENENDSPIGLNNSLNYQSFIKPNDGITIAVLDTGVNVNYAGFNVPFLYDAIGSQWNLECQDQVSGWDFVNGDDNPHDDYAKIHGTKVSYIIHEQLIANGIPHQILPLKVADNQGKISAFNLICGIKNAVELADIINLSLGYYSNGEDAKSTIIEDLIIENNEILFVTSAGNNNTNNDNNENGFKHYPSDYPQQNVLAIAAANEIGIEKASFSNYGTVAIDFYAIGEDVEFIEYVSSTIVRRGISGTSYAAPYVTAVATKILFNTGLHPSGIIQELDRIGLPIVQDSGKVKYEKIIQ